jgi:hypothetical protein
VPTLLRIAAIYSLACAIGLACSDLWPAIGPAPGPEARSLALALAIANLAYALLLWPAARRPAEHRLVLYMALTVFGLRAVLGTWEVLYTLEGGPAVVRLFDMVASLALFVGILNGLPSVLAEPPARR